MNVVISVDAKFTVLDRYNPTKYHKGPSIKDVCIFNGRDQKLAKYAKIVRIYQRLKWMVPNLINSLNDN